MNRQMLKLMRPKQWIKNVFVLVPLIFSKTFTHPDAALKAIFTLICFIAASSAIYILNDMIDIDKDKLHETKRLRPLASGSVKRGSASVVMILLLTASLVAAYYIHPSVVACLVGYAAMNVLYTLILKKIAILDIMVISFGFVLRVIAGAAAIQVYISSWVLLCTFFIALCLAAGKRKSEKASLQENSVRHRSVLSYYTDDFLKAMIQISVTGTAITYSLYTILEYENQLPMITILFVFFGLFRYMQLILEEQEGRLPEEIILSDRLLLISILLFGAAWIVLFLVSGSTG